MLIGEPAEAARAPERLLLSPTALASADPEVAEATRDAAGSLADRLGASVAETQLLGDEAPAPADALGAFNVLQGAQVWANYGEWFEGSKPSMGADIAARFERAKGFSPADVAEAEPVARAVADAVGRLGGGEALLLPAAGTVAPGREADPSEREQARVAAGQLTCLASLAGAPAVAIPLMEVQGLPAGVSLVGPPGSDLGLLAAVSAAPAEPS